MSENENSTPVVENNVNASENNDSQQKLSYEDLQNELKKVRAEAASRRIANRELEEKAKRWEEYEESQKTELQKLQEALAERDKALANLSLEKEKQSLIKEFGLEDDDIDLLTGADVDTNRKIAEKLKAKAEKFNKNTSSSRPADLLAGNRGTPVGSANDTNSVDAMIRRMAGR
jgi:tRNA/tmRNA/rRNA uracil-C5-methylase (TrmA/RlmC/RlmD family)